MDFTVIKGRLSFFYVFTDEKLAEKKHTVTKNKNTTHTGSGELLRRKRRGNWSPSDPQTGRATWASQACKSPCNTRLCRRLLRYWPFHLPHKFLKIIEDSIGKSHLLLNLSALPLSIMAMEIVLVRNKREETRHKIILRLVAIKVKTHG